MNVPRMSSLPKFTRPFFISLLACMIFVVADINNVQAKTSSKDSLLEYIIDASSNHDWQNRKQSGKRPNKQFDNEHFQKRREEIRKELESLPPEERAQRMKELREQFREKREEMVQKRKEKFQQRWKNATPEEKQKFCSNVQQKCADGRSRACEIAERACGNF